MKFIRQNTVAHACYDYSWQGIEVRLWELQGMRPERALGQPVTFAVNTDPGARSEPTFRLNPEAAQQLMDALWDCGIRPTEGKGSAGQMAATERHLKDMRAFVFNSLKIPLPPE